MSTLPSDVAINNANQILSLVQQIKNMRAQITELVNVNGTNPFGTAWATLHTTALATDGTLGTADTGAPIAADPIDTRVYVNLTRAAKLADLNNALQIIVDFSTFCSGGALTANASRPGQINNVAA